MSRRTTKRYIITRAACIEEPNHKNF